MTTPLERLAARILAKVRPHSADADGVSALTLVRYMASKGGAAAVRGAVRRLRFGRGAFPLFIGTKVKIAFPEKLTTGTGVLIGDFCRLNCYSTDGVTLGDRVTLREFGWLQLSSSVGSPGHSISVGNDTYIGPYWVLGAAAPIKVGRRCQFGARVSLVAEMHQFSAEGETFGAGVTRAGIEIGDDVWIGDGVSVLDGVTIGSGSVIGAGSVVTRSVPANAVAAGVPCKVIRTLEDDGAGR